MFSVVVEALNQNMYDMENRSVSVYNQYYREIDNLASDSLLYALLMFVLKGNSLVAAARLAGVGPPLPSKLLKSLLKKIQQSMRNVAQSLVHFDMIASCRYCRSVCCTFMMQFSGSTTFQRCSIEFRSGDYDCLSTMKLLSLCERI